MEKHTIIDAHVHISPQFDASAVTDFFTGGDARADKACICAVAHSTGISLTEMALDAKRRAPDRFYVFGCPDAGAYSHCTDTLGEYQAAHCQKLMEMGCDGIKMLEGKPQMRKKYPLPDFSSPCWEEYWAWAERTQTPILMHLNDPENFWDAANAPAFAVQQGWLYDESYVNNEAQYAQMLSVLARHPRLKICFAHFFFMSAQLDRLGAILDAYENVCVDITPGIEMYENFSNNFAAARAFFAKYHNRIIYGTDIGGRCVLMGEDKPFNRNENCRRPLIVQQFLAGKGEIEIRSDGDFLIGRAPFTMRCLGLEGAALDEILSGNFMRFVSNTPRRVPHG